MMHLATPWALCLLPLPWLIWKGCAPAKIPPLAALYVPFLDLIAPALTHLTVRRHDTHSWWVLTGVWTLLVLAAAGPQWLGPPFPPSQPGRNIFLILDISGSMQVPDMIMNRHAYTRLHVVKRAAEAFVQARPLDHLGLILFGSEAYLQTPLTYDHQTILHRLQDATVGLAGHTTALGDALALAVKQLQPSPRQGRVAILLTDGANNAGVLSPEKAAELATAHHIKVYTIGLAAPQQPTQFAQLFMSMQNNNDLDEQTLQNIAQQTQGKYFRATDPHSLQHIYQTIDALETTTHTLPPERPLQELYPWLLCLAMAVLNGWFWRYLRPNKHYTRAQPQESRP